MAHILGIGVATLDIIHSVDGYPPEDSKLRATARRICRGGNATNTLVVLSQLGHQCTWGGTLGDDPAAHSILADLSRYHIDHSPCRIIPEGNTPTSCILQNERNGSRTIVHYRELPEYAYMDFKNIPLEGFNWLHFEGRNVPETAKMLHHARHTVPALPRSLEIEKPRPGIEALLALADLLLFSRDYARASGWNDAQQFLAAQRNRHPETDLVCTWGAVGAYSLSRSGEASHCPATPPGTVIDTLGAGDTFNAGMIDALVRAGTPLSAALRRACNLAGTACIHQGLEIPTARNIKTEIR